MAAPASLTDLQTAAEASGGIAQLRNVGAFAAALEDARRRPHHLPGLVCMYGPSGWGKTRAATFGANLHRAVYVEARSTWTKRAFCRAILHEQGIEPDGRVYEMVERIAQGLMANETPLIVDEADFVLQAGMIEIVRDIHEASGAVVALIGEERLPNKLRAVERVHNRVAFWVAAQPCDLQDAKELARLYQPKLTLADDLLEKVVQASAGGARRIVTNLHNIALEAKKAPAEVLDVRWWGRKSLFTGDVEARAALAAPRRAG
jgi:DNA transposition AAA+ family ATPase